MIPTIPTIMELQKIPMILLDSLYFQCVPGSKKTQSVHTRLLAPRKAHMFTYAVMSEYVEGCSIRASSEVIQAKHPKNAELEPWRTGAKAMRCCPKRIQTQSTAEK